MRCVMCISLVVLSLAPAIAAQTGAAADSAAAPTHNVSRSMLDFIRAGGPVGYVIILLSVGVLALVIDTFLRTRRDRLIPPALADELDRLARQGRFGDVLATAKTSDSTLGRIVAAGVARGEQGLPAIREGLQEAGTREMTRLFQQIGYIGLATTIAPMLGLLGTVTGMTRSFNVMGMTKGAARPDELAVGIAEALVTTVMGLALALPLACLHSWFRDRVTKAGQETSAICERLLRSMTLAHEARQVSRTTTPQLQTVR